MTAESETAGTAGLRRQVGYSLVTGLTHLIPVPFLDDWAKDLLRQRQAMELARDRGVHLTGAEGKILACGHHPPTARGCVRGCLFALVVIPVELLFKVFFNKIVRKVLFFLTVKDVIDTFSRTLHEGYLLRHALKLGALTPAPVPQGEPAPPPPPEAVPGAPTAHQGAPPPTTGEVVSGPPRPRVLALRRAIEATCDEVDPRPIEKVASVSLRGSWRLLRRAGHAMSRRLRALRRSGPHPDERAVFERLERRGEEELGGLIDEMTADLAGQTPYLEALRQRLEQRLANADSSTP